MNDKILTEKDLTVTDVSNRDYRGLLKGVEYKFRDIGLGNLNPVDWRAMLKPEHLGFNRQKEAEISGKYGKPFNSIKPSDVDPDSLEDSHLIILLSGIRYLDYLRGSIDVIPQVNISRPGHCSVTTMIRWIGNFESGYVEQTFGDTGLATFENTFNFAANYLDSIATNRAYVRAVRNYLRVNIVASDEIGPVWTPKSERAPSAGRPADIFKASLTEKNITFDKFKTHLVKKYVSTGKIVLESDPTTWNSVDDIPVNDIYTLNTVLEGSKS